MQWLGRRESSNVDDRRGLSGGKVAAGGGIASVVVYLIYSFLSGNSVDPSQIQQKLSPQTDQSASLSPEEQKAKASAVHALRLGLKTFLKLFAPF